MKAGASLLLAAAAFCGSSASLAAGGHHSVDDAAVLKQGECEVESWFTRTQDRIRLVHTGMNCGVASWLELGGAGDYARFAEGNSETAWSLQAKAAHAISDTVSVAAVIVPVWLARNQPRYAGTALIGAVTWTVHDNVTLHLNLGREFVNQSPDNGRGGLSLEWTPMTDWSFVAERYKERDTHFARAGVRWSPADGWQVDLSRAQRLSGPLSSQWTAGVTYSWE